MGRGIDIDSFLQWSIWLFSFFKHLAEMASSEIYPNIRSQIMAIESLTNSYIDFNSPAWPLSRDNGSDSISDQLLK